MKQLGNKGGTVPNIEPMRTCLLNNGWTAAFSIPSAFSDYPLITFASHNNNHFGDSNITILLQLFIIIMAQLLIKLNIIA